MDTSYEGRRFLLDGADENEKTSIEEFFKDIPIKPPKFLPPGTEVKVVPGEKIVTGRASDFIYTLRHKPGEVIESHGRKYIVGEDGAWRRLE